MVKMGLVLLLFLAAHVAGPGWIGGAAYVAAACLLAVLASATASDLRHLADGLGGIARGEIGEREAAVGEGRGAVWDALAQMRSNLGEIVKQVRASAESIARGSREMSEGHASLSQRTEAQASTLEQTASGMEELESSVRQNAASCKSAAELAQASLAAARRGADAVRLASGSMAAIEAESRRMAEITGVIEGLAFQTNILALNAAVEAARAGEQGRGFAVVASEVRALAQRSAEAAKQIKALIAQSVGQISDGGRHAVAAGRGMDEIVTGVEQVHRLVAEVAHASAEQSAGVGEVNKAILQLEGVTQQNATLVEQAAAAALNFRDEAGRLLEVVDAFKLDRMEVREQAVALVARAAAHLSEHGPERAFRDFEDPRGGFIAGDFYVFVLDLDCIVRSHGTEPHTRGRNNSTVTDVDGKAFAREFVQVARTRGRGWVDYRWQNHATGQVQPKSTYIERSGDYLVGCGIYRAEAAISLPYTQSRKTVFSARLPSS